MVSVSSHLKQVASAAMPDLNALFWVQTVRVENLEQRYFFNVPALRNSSVWDIYIGP